MAGGRQAKRAGVSKTTAKQPPQTKNNPYNRTPEQQFLAWCKKVNLKHPKCTIGKLPTGRGVVATQDIKKGEVVIEVPDSVVLMVEQCRISEELFEAGLAKGMAGDALLEVQGLVLAVMSEKVLGTASDWSPYLSFIPDDMSHMPMFWKAEELAELAGTAALDKMEGKVQTPADAPTQVRMLWEEVAQPFIMENPKLKIPTGAKGWSLYQWATAAVSSYSFIIGEAHYQAMVPFWDALNHITGAINIRLNHQPTKGGDGCLQMIAIRDISQGEELVNNYGELSQSYVDGGLQAELLRAYGYVETHANANMHAHVQVPLRFVLQGVAVVLCPEQHNKPTQSLTGKDSAGAVTSDCEADDAGNDSDGGSDWGLDSEGSDDEDQDGGGSVPDDVKQQEAKAVVEDSNDRPQGQGPVASQGLASRCGQIRMSEVRRSIRGLPGRLRFLKRLGLLPKANVYKVFSPEPQDSRPGAAYLSESIRLLMLPYNQFSAVRQAVMTWKPKASTNADGNDQLDGPKKIQKRTGDVLSQAGGHTDDNPSSSAVGHVGPLVVDVGEAGGDMAQHVRNVVYCIAQYMLGRYTCGLEADEQLLASASVVAGSESVASQGTVNMVEGTASEGQGDGHRTVEPPTRKMSAVVARVLEKRCLHALLGWWGHHQGDDDEGRDEARLQQVLTACWAQPRPGMHGMPRAAEDSDDEGDDDSDEGEDGSTEEGDEGGSGSDDGLDGEEGQQEEEEDVEASGDEEEAGSVHGEAGVQVKGRVKTSKDSVRGDAALTGKRKRLEPASACDTREAATGKQAKVGKGKAKSSAAQDVDAGSVDVRGAGKAGKVGPVKGRVSDASGGKAKGGDAGGFTFAFQF